MRYEVKSWTHFFQAIRSGEKKHDMRDMRDRPYRVGDELLLREFDNIRGEYTGEEELVRITYITNRDTPCAFSSAALDRNFAILSLEPIRESIKRAELQSIMDAMPLASHLFDDGPNQ